MNAIEISKLRQTARQLKRSTGVTHYEALDNVAREHGYERWSALIASSRFDAALLAHEESELQRVTALSRAPAIAQPTPKSWSCVFHHVRIEAMVFRAFATDEGPYLNGAVHSFKSLEGGGQVALGVCGIVRFEEDVAYMRVSAGEWWVCKYTRESRIPVSALSPQGRNALAYEFGIAHGPTGISDDHGRRFLKSPAFSSLKEWVRLHPRLARTLSKSHAPYVPGWYEYATDQEPPWTLRNIRDKP